MDTRLPPGTDLTGLDPHQVYFAVFDPLDDRSHDGPWGFSERVSARRFARQPDAAA